MKFLGKIIVLVPFCYLLYILFINKNLFDPFYFYGFFGLSVLGLVGLLFNINYNLSIIYLLISFVTYSVFYDNNIYNLWAVGGLILLIRFSEKPLVKKESATVVVEEKPVRNDPVSSERVKKEVPVVKEVPKKEPKKEVSKKDYWSKYEDKNKFNKIKKKLIKLIRDPYGIN
jgi:hypothetical protein